MKLNPDCIRDILMCVEALDYDEVIYFSSIIEKLDTYDSKDILYHIRQCEYNGFFTKIKWYTNTYEDEEGIIYDLTPKAHEFLANIRSDNVWSKTKNVASKVGSIALPALQQIAAGLIEAAIKSQFCP